jgi:hypothetical protein
MVINRQNWKVQHHFCRFLTICGGQLVEGNAYPVHMPSSFDSQKKKKKVT